VTAARTSSSKNGSTQVVDLDAILGPRARERTVTFGGERYTFGPLSLVTARLLEQGKVEDALASLLPNPDEYERFIRAVPAAVLDKALIGIYGEAVLGEAVPPPRTSSRAKSASKPSKRTSRRAASD